MAGRLLKSFTSLSKSRLNADIISRGLSSSGSLCQETGGWLDKLLVRKIEPTKESHSRMLSDKEVIYELQTHNLKPGTSEEYLKNYEQYVQEVKARNMHLELSGSWTVGVGDQDQCLHLWKYDGGYKSIDQAKEIMDTDKVLKALVNDRNQHLRARTNQFLLSFSFWPAVTAREGRNIYEIRSYFLKPGTMIEWGNNWARAITFRQSNNEAFGGFFSQVGRLYNVHHIWCYRSLEDRREQRENAWRKPGWDEVVAYTVPLIEEYCSRIIYPNTFSPTN